MATEKVLLELGEKDLKEILCKHYNIQESTAVMTVSKFDGSNDPRERPYTSIVITGFKKTLTTINNVT